jgi:hypothetical protein
MEWLQRNTSPGERVYHTDWDDFPEMFYWNTHNTYMVGLDPTYMYLENPDLYLLWRSIGRGQVPAPSGYIREEFQARWVVTDRGHRNFIRHASVDPGLAIAFQTEDTIVYRLVD